MVRFSLPSFYLFLFPFFKCLHVAFNLFYVTPEIDDETLGKFLDMNQTVKESEVTKGRH